MAVVDRYFSVSCSPLMWANADKGKAQQAPKAQD